jgi:TctA family transporter
MSLLTAIVSKLLLLFIIASVIGYDYFFDGSVTINSALSVDFSGFFNLSLLVLYVGNIPLVY